MTVIFLSNLLTKRLAVRIIYVYITNAMKEKVIFPQTVFRECLS